MSISVLSVVLNNFKNDSRVIKEGISLQNSGYDVQVVALHEDGLSERSIEHNLNVHRVKLRSRSWPKHKLIQILKYLEFIIRVLFIYRKKVDVVHCHDLNALPIGFLIKLLSLGKKNIVYDAHEFETDVHGLSRSSKAVMYILEKFLIKFSDANIIPSRMAAEHYSEMYSIDQPVEVLNCPYYSEIRTSNILREELSIGEDKIIFLYQGVLAEGRGIETLLEVFSELNSERAVMVFMGFGPLESKVKSIASTNSKVYFRSGVSPDVLHSYTASCDIGISLIEDTCLSYRYCMPNKLFEYFMAGLPVVVSARPMMKEIVDGAGVGVVAETDSVTDFRLAVEKILNSDLGLMKENIENLNRSKKFTWENQEEKLLNIYKSL